MPFQACIDDRRVWHFPCLPDLFQVMPTGHDRSIRIRLKISKQISTYLHFYVSSGHLYKHTLPTRSKLQLTENIYDENIALHKLFHFITLTVPITNKFNEYASTSFTTCFHLLRSTVSRRSNNTSKINQYFTVAAFGTKPDMECLRNDDLLLYCSVVELWWHRLSGRLSLSFLPPADSRDHGKRQNFEMWMRDSILTSGFSTLYSTAIERRHTATTGTWTVFSETWIE